MPFSGRLVGAGGSSSNKVNVRNGRLQIEPLSANLGVQWLQATLPEVAVGLGTVPGVGSDGKFGINRDVLAGSTPQTVWTPSGLYPYQDVVYQAELVSDSAADSAAGTGARTVLIEGLAGAGRTEETETVTMNGLAPVLTARTDWIRINRIFNLTAGTTRVNEGTIDCQLAGGGDLQAQIVPGVGQSQQAIYAVPGAKRALVVSWFAQLSDVGVAEEIELGIFTRNSLVPDAAFRQRAELALTGGATSAFGGQLPIPFLVGLPGADMEVRVLEAGGPNLTVTSTFTILLVDASFVT